MKQEERKNLKIEPTLHKRMMLAKAETGKELYELASEAWDAFETSRCPKSVRTGTGTVHVIERTAAAKLLPEVEWVANIYAKADNDRTPAEKTVAHVVTQFLKAQKKS